MRYLIFSAHFPPFLGGIPNFVSHLAEELTKEGDEVYVVTSALGERKPGWAQPSERLRVLYLPTRACMAGRLPLLKKNRTYRRLMRELASISFDRVLVNARFYQLSLVGLQFASKQKVPAVLLDHGSEPLTLNQRFLDRLLFAYERHMTNKCKAYHPQFAGISKASLRLLERFGIITSTIIPNAIDVDAFCGARSSRNYRDELNIPKTSRVATHISRLEPEKGSELVLEAARELPDVQFIFAGEGSLAPRIKEAALTIQNVHYVGSLDSSEVAALLAVSDVLVFPTRSEGGGMIVLEAAAQGVPVVATNTGHIKAVLPKEEWCQECSRTVDSVVNGIKIILSKDRTCSEIQDNVRKNWGFSNSIKALDKAFVCPKKLSNKDYDSIVLPKLQKELSELLDVFDMTCKKLHIDYWIEGGTLLGAVRHNGFIPWDDDIDVGLLEKDWNLFLAKADEVLPKGYKIISKKNTKGFSALWVCLTKEGTRFIDEDHFFSRVDQGVYIDVFQFVPLDERTIHAQIQRLRLRFWQGVSYLRAIPYPHVVFHVLAKMVSEKTIQKRFWKAAHTTHPGNKLINPSYADYAPIPREVILPTRPIAFRDLQVMGPADPERYLELEYGNWQEIPPPEKRHTHTPLILDLGDGINVMGDKEV